MVEVTELIEFKLMVIISCTNIYTDVNTTKHIFLILVINNVGYGLDAAADIWWSVVRQVMFISAPMCCMYVYIDWQRKRQNTQHQHENVNLKQRNVHLYTLH